MCKIVGFSPPLYKLRFLQQLYELLRDQTKCEQGIFLSLSKKSQQDCKHGLQPL